MEIQELDQRTVELIVGGEVYVRPLSIVKECVENSLDAGSTRIRIYIENGGYTKIQVEDDGSGIPQRLLPGLCKAHNSTKDRLARNTLGFRGEALACLCYMSNLSVHTKTESDDIGHVTRYEDGVMSDLQPKVMSVDHGTVIEVTDIYKVHKVRRSNKSQASTERAAIAAFLVDLKVFYSDVVISLVDQTGIILKAATPAPDRSYESRVPVLCANFPSLRPDYLTRLDFVRVWGSVRGIISVKQGQDQLTDSKFITFVNSRPVAWINFRRMVMKLYESYMSVANSMNLMLFWDIELKVTDENVDRSKLNIQVMDESSVLADIESELRMSLDRGVTQVVRRTSMKREEDSSMTPPAFPKSQTPGDYKVSRLSFAPKNGGSAAVASVGTDAANAEQFYLDTTRCAPTKPQSRKASFLPSPSAGTMARPPPKETVIYSKFESADAPAGKLPALEVDAEQSNERPSSQDEGTTSSESALQLIGKSGEWSEDPEEARLRKRQEVTNALQPSPPVEDNTDLKTMLMDGQFEALTGFEFIGTVDMRRFVAGNDSCIVTLDISTALKELIVPSLITRIKLRPELNLLEADFMPAGAAVPERSLCCKTLGLVIKDFVLKSVPRLPASEPNVGVWVQLIYERGLECTFGAATVVEMMLEHEHRLQSHYMRFISGVKLWEAWLNKNMSVPPDEVVVSPPLKIILRHFERC